MTEATARTAIQALSRDGVTGADIENVSTEGGRTTCDLVFNVGERAVTLVGLKVDDWSDLPGFAAAEITEQRTR